MYYTINIIIGFVGHHILCRGRLVTLENRDNYLASQVLITE